MSLALALALFLPTFAHADCAVSPRGIPVCGEGTCLVGRDGPACAAIPRGGAAVGDDGVPRCGVGACAAGADGLVWCGAAPGRGAAVDANGDVACAGEDGEYHPEACLPGDVALCVGVPVGGA